MCEAVLGDFTVCILISKLEHLRWVRVVVMMSDAGRGEFCRLCYRCARRLCVVVYTMNWFVLKYRLKLSSQGSRASPRIVFEPRWVIGGGPPDPRYPGVS